MKKIFATFAGLALVACAEQSVDVSVTPESAPLTVTVEQGALQGFHADTGARVWRGVPFAADTTGENRWRAPRPAPAWDGVRVASEFAPPCAQIATPFTQVPGFENGELAGSEDCLAVDIYAPETASDEPLPVLFWIHGGSNMSGASQLYVGDQLVQNENVIVVSTQYRLGPLGWFSHQDLIESAERPEDAAANFGTLDLIASLKWVRANIAGFGGDPDNITIFGESAGGHNVATLLASPLAEGLFSQAIIQSGSFDSVSVSEARGDAGALLNSSNGIAERLGGFERFHTASLQDVFDAYQLSDGFLEVPRVIQDGVSLPQFPLRDAFADTETFQTVPIITGTNRDEMKLFYLLDERYTEQVDGQFYVARDQDFYDAASDYSSRLWRIRAVDRPASLMRQAGHDQVYAYRFDWDEGGKFMQMDFSKMLGAAHGVEIPFVFNRFVLLGAVDPIMFPVETLDSRNQLSQTMGAYWASFARGTPPSDGNGGVWPVYGADANLMYFDTRQDGGIRVEAGVDTVAQLVADLKHDTRVDQAQRCLIADGITDVLGNEVAEGIETLECPLR
ncbi:MAG: carboxylesterase family protein [Henriciella sp.]|nr:carboxylesterase family protein [Henriciella sp.]